MSITLGLRCVVREVNTCHKYSSQWIDLLIIFKLHVLSEFSGTFRLQSFPDKGTVVEE